MFNGKRLSGWMALAVFATVGGAMVAADPAFAKVDVDKLTISGEARMRYEIRTGATFGGTQANESAASHRIRIGVGYDLTPDVSFFAQLQDARIWGSEASATATTSGLAAVSSANGNANGVDLHQGYLQVKNLLVPGLSLKAGRQEIIYGDHRLFGNFGWSQVGNSFDAVKLTHSSALADLDLFWARIAETEGGGGCPTGNTTGSCNGVIFPVAGTSGGTDQNIYGAYLTLKPIKNWTIEPYWFLLNDGRVNGTTNAITGQASDQTRHTFGGRINGKAGGLDTTLEAVGQKGEMGNGLVSANSPALRLAINAHAEAAKIGYTFDAVPMKPRIGFEFDYASGDNCVNGTAAQGCGTGGNSGLISQGHMNTFDNLFPTNHFHYGYMDLMAWKNMVNYQVMFDVKPSPVSKLQFNYIIHRLARTTDNWYRAGQVAYATTAASNQEASLGQELDVHYWHTFKEKFKFDLGFGHFFAGAFLDKTAGMNPGSNNGPISTTTFTSNGDQNWGYVMGSVLF
jgi:hypothetical protein